MPSLYARLSLGSRDTTLNQHGLYPHEIHILMEGVKNKRKNTKKKYIHRCKYSGGKSSFNMGKGCYDIVGGDSFT